MENIAIDSAFLVSVHSVTCQQVYLVLHSSFDDSLPALAAREQHP